MGRKRIKDLDDDILQLSKLMNEVKQKLDEIYKKYDDLEEKVLNSVLKMMFRCVRGNSRKQEKVRMRMFLLNVIFVKENLMNSGKLGAHVKTHSNVKCEWFV